MDRHRSEKRRKAPRSVMRSVWVPLFAAILLIYMVFMIHVNYYATTTATTANGVGAAPPTKGQAAPLAREMQEQNNAPEPALAQAATRPVVPLRPEMKRPTRQPDLRVGAITKAPAPTTAAPTTPPPPPTTTAPPPVTTKVSATTTMPTEVEAAAAAAPVDAVQTAKPVAAPIDKGHAVETAKPVEAPLVKDLTEAPATISSVSFTQTTEAPVAAPVAAPVVEQNDPLAGRHDTLRGYRQTMNYLSTFKASPGESLFLYFTCSDDDFNPHDWSTECTDASKKVYDVFGKSPSTNKLVTIYAGSERFWNYQNKFRNDRDLRIKTVPAILKWHGNGGETSGMMITDSLTDEPFLRYLFKNVDRPDLFLNAAAMVETKTIETVQSYEAYQAKLEDYKLEPKPRRPLYLMFVSGRIAENNRPWCPYCRFSELPLEYGFKAFAPPNARLLRVEVAQTYQEWKTPNKFNHDPALGPLRGVPGFFTVQQLATKELKFDRIYERFDRIVTLRNLFQTAARVRDE